MWHGLLLAGRSVDGKRRGNSVRGVVPRSVEARPAITPAGGNAPVITHVGDGYVWPVLGLIAVPDLRDPLAICKSKCQCPVGKGGCACVLDSDRRSEPTLPLARHRIDNVASEAGLCGHSQRDRSAGSRSSRATSPTILP
jgi:hypothetical protein